MPKPIKAKSLRSPIARLQAQLGAVTRADMMSWLRGMPEHVEPAVDLEDLYETEAELRGAVESHMPDNKVLEMALDVVERAPQSILAKRLIVRGTPLAPQFHLRWLVLSYRDALEIVGKKFVDDYMGRFGDHPFGLELMFFLADIAIASQGDVDMTLTAGERLLELDKRDPIDLGAFVVSCYLQLDRVDDARTLIDRVTPENAPDRWALFAALVMKRSGDEEKARAHLEHVYKVTPYLKTLLADPALANFPDGTTPPDGWDDAMNLLDTVIETFMTPEERAWLLTSP